MFKPGATATADEVRDFCRDQNAHCKVPRHVRFVSELPMTANGKAQKVRMRQAVVDEFGLDGSR